MKCQKDLEVLILQITLCLNHLKLCLRIVTTQDNLQSITTHPTDLMEDNLMSLISQPEIKDQLSMNLNQNNKKDEPAHLH